MLETCHYCGGQHTAADSVCNHHMLRDHIDELIELVQKMKKRANAVDSFLIQTYARLGVNDCGECILPGQWWYEIEAILGHGEVTEGEQRNPPVRPL